MDDCLCFAVPTCNRPMHLLRCIDTAARSPSSRSTALLIAEDGASCSRIITALSERSTYWRQIYYLSRSGKYHFGEFLSRDSGVPLERVLSAFFSDDPTEASYGGNQNFILLFTKGHRVVVTDDDVDLRPAVSGKPMGAASLVEPEEVDFLPSVRASSRFVRSIDLDAITAVAGTARATERECIRVAGLYGDAGMDSSLPYLTSRSEGTYARLISSLNVFNYALHSRSIVRHAPELTSIPVGTFMSACYSVTNDKPLAPFFPTFRGSDGNFGRALFLVNPEYRMTFLPFAVRHDPPSKRPYVNYNDRVSFASVCAAALDHYRARTTQVENDPESRRQALGQFFVQLAQQESRLLESFLLTALRARLSAIVDKLVMRLSAPQPPPGYFEDAAVEYLHGLELLMQRTHLAVPYDFPDQDSETALRRIHHWFEAWGQLCLAWGDLERSALKFDRRHFTLA